MTIIVRTKLCQAKIYVLTSTFRRTRKEAGNDRDGLRPEREHKRQTHKQEVMFKKMSVITVVKSCSFID